ncbi:MAG: ATP synthase F1 subunit gamma [Parcubacteria group bacterium]|nr:ATP synthase F1 subunit gamma [Parcubacteria group bacterium]
MATVRDIKRRMRSIRNTGQITRAMEAVSATKMRRSQAIALKARPYAVKALELLGNIAQFGGGSIHDFFMTRASGPELIVLVTSDKGLCGSLNSNIIRQFKTLENSAEKRDIVVVGKRGRDFLRRRTIEPVFAYTGIGDYATLSDTRPIAEFILELFEKRQYRKVLMIYTTFHSTLRQEAISRQILPLHKKTLDAVVRDILPEYGRFSEGAPADHSVAQAYEYVFEPRHEVLLREMLPVLATVMVHHAILEANASEHSARMIAMKNASENATEILRDLTISFNAARQATITREIVEVTTGALSQSR